MRCRLLNPQLGLDSVSYTHLDVYKRQIQHRGSFGQLAQVAAGGEDENFARGGLGVEVLGQRTGLVFH